MTGPGNADRAAWAAQAIGVFQSAAGQHGGLDTAGGTSRPRAAGRPATRQIPGWLSAPCVRRAPCTRQTGGSTDDDAG